MINYEKLENRLKEMGTNRTKMAKDLGISSRTITKIGRGEPLSSIVLNKMAAYLQCRVEDLYDESPEERFDAGFCSNNASYVVDPQYRVVDFNRAMAAHYPELRKGDICYQAIMKQQNICRSCPLRLNTDEELPFYNSDLKRWVSISRAAINYPGVGTCGLLLCKGSRNMHRSIKSRLPLMSGYDVYIEMNLTQNCYRIILPNDPAQEKDFSNDNLDEFIRRTADHLLHPDDRDAFLEFWDIKTLMARISGPEREIHGVFRECRKKGVWDTIYVTIVPEEYYGTSDVMIMALYTIIPGHIAESTEEPETGSTYADGRKINYDHITGLPLRRSFWEFVDHKVNEGGDGAEYCVLAFDIEDFHVINNWYGRAAGDALLNEVGAYFRQQDNTGRTMSGYMGGDNFCTVFPYNEHTIARITEDVREMIGSFRDIRGFRALIGGYRTDFRNSTAAEAYDHCIIAMKQNENSPDDSIRWYDQTMVQQQQTEDQLLLQLSSGLEKGEVCFYLQPKCDLRTGRIIGAEALARWSSPELGFVSPGVFIPVLEKHGKISSVDYYIWDRVCRTVAQWRANGLPVLPVSVNVSRIDIFSMDIVHVFTSLILKYGLSPNDIEIEITESAYVENDSILREVQGGLRAAGFKTYIDDFGSGYSSLNFLNDIDSDAIKLDLRFLLLKEENAEKGSNILSSILSMAEKLNLVVIAEGVETREQVDFLAYNGCPLAQGYYFYRPMPVPDFEKLLEDRSRLMEGTCITDFAPRKPDETCPDMKVFAGYDEHLANYMKTLMDVAALVRVVDVREWKDYRIGSNGRLTVQEGHCFDLWGSTAPCRDCISSLAVSTRKAASRYTTVGRNSYYIIAKPVIIGGVVHSLETAIKML